MSGFTKVAWLQGFGPPHLQYPWTISRCVRVSPLNATFSGCSAPESRSTRSCRPDRRTVVSRRVEAAQTRTPYAGVSRGAHGFLAPIRDPWVSLARVTCRSGLRQIGHPRPELSMSDPQVLRFSRAGHCPPRRARTNRDLPHGNSLATRKDAMIRRLCLVAGPAGSEWLTRTFIDWSIDIY